MDYSCRCTGQRILKIVLASQKLLKNYIAGDIVRHLEPAIVLRPCTS